MSLTLARTSATSGDPRDPPDAATARAEARQLIALARESQASGVGRRALVLRLSLLAEGWAEGRARPHHRRLAQEALLPLIEADRARLFRLPNADLAVVWRGPAETALRACREALRLLFGGDTTPPELAVVLDLPARAARLLELAEAGLRPRAVAHKAAVRAPPLDPATLAALEAALGQVGMARFLRRQPVCAPHGQGFVRRWERLGLAVAEIGETMLPGRDLLADPWLLRRLGRTLERRLLALLAAPGELRGAGPLGLTLTTAGLLGPEFLRFDANLPPGLRGEVAVILRSADILADPAAFLFARDFARTRRYRLGFAAADPMQAALLPLDALGLDLLLVDWSAALAQAAAPVLPDAGRIVLCGADDAAALAWGAARGIGLYQGRAIRLSSRVAP